MILPALTLLIAIISEGQKSKTPALQKILGGGRSSAVEKIGGFSSIEELRSILSGLEGSEIQSIQDELDAADAELSSALARFPSFYHGSTLPIIEKIREGGFKLTKGRRSGFLGSDVQVDNLAVFLSKSKAMARAYGQNRDATGGRNSGVIEVKVKTSSTFNMNSWGTTTPLDIRKVALGLIYKEIGRKVRKPRQDDIYWLVDQPEFIHILQAYGYDSASFMESPSTLRSLGLDKSEGQTLAVFDPSDIFLSPKPFRGIGGLFRYLKLEEQSQKGQ